MNLQHERIGALCAQLKLDCIATDWAPRTTHRNHRFEYG